jgi:hypothetical protein
MKRAAKILLILALIVGIDRFCHEQTGTFSLYKIQDNRPGDPIFELANQPSADALLNQPYRFLGHGNECFAFISADNTTILKVFKLQFLRPAYLKPACKAPLKKFKETLCAARKERLKRTFDSIQIACEDLKEETALVYIHLAPTHHLKKSLTIIDKIGIAHQIDLDQTKFILQKRANLVYPHLNALMKENKVDEAKECLTSLIQLIKTRYEKGISDRDARLEDNFGFIGSIAVEIDVGSFSRDNTIKTPENTEHLLFQETLPLKTWLAKHPILLEHLNSTISKN